MRLRIEIEKKADSLSTEYTLHKSQIQCKVESMIRLTVSSYRKVSRRRRRRRRGFLRMNESSRVN